MNFVSRDHLFSYLKQLLFIGLGSQGECYLDKKTNIVYKIFHQYIDDLKDDWKLNYDKENLLKFSNIENNTYVFPLDVISVGDEIVGYTCDYINGNSLFRINPLRVNLDKFCNSISNTLNDVRVISDNSVRSFDVMYNTIYCDDDIRVIDCDDSSFSDLDKDRLFRINYDNLNSEILYFLVDNYFDEFVAKYPLLNEMYTSSGVDIKEFINLFRRYLSEVVGSNINTLGDAKKCLNKTKRDLRYQRSIAK